MKNLRLNIKKISLILGMSVGLTLMGGCSQKSENKKVIEIVDEMKDSTCLDELIGANKLEAIDELLEYIDLSKTLNRLKIKDVDININDYKLLSPYEIRKLITIYTNKDAPKYLTETERIQNEEELLAEKKLVNSYIYNVGYNISKDFLLAVLKSEILDAQGLDENSANTITIVSEKESYINRIPLPFGDIIRLTDNIETSDRNLINSLASFYYMEKKGETRNIRTSDPSEYNKDRNKMIKEAIENGIKTSKKEYILKKGKIKRK